MAHPKSEALGEAYRHLAEGEDYESLGKMIGDLTDEQALTIPPGAPYSIARMVRHMAFWQEVFVGGVLGEEFDGETLGREDWAQVKPGEWAAIRDRCLAAFAKARVVLESLDEPDRLLSYGRSASATLTRGALHDAYHLGQIALLRQLLGLWPVAGGTDVWK